MTNTDSTAGSTWPTPKFSFQVIWEGTEFLFQEVTGLSAETEIIEFRNGNRPHTSVKMPGIQKFGNIALKKGIFKGDVELWQRFSKENSSKRSTVIINLLDEARGVAMSWTLTNVFPVKVTATDLKTDANEVDLETMELAHEGLKLIE